MDKPRLKTRVKTRFEVDYGDFDRFVEEIYGGRFEFVAINEANNYSNYTFEVTEEDINDIDEEDEIAIRKGKYPMYCAHTVFALLCKDGYIPKGEYIIDVFW